MREHLKNIVVWILTTEARLALKKFEPKIIAITGNVGKTSTKDAIFAVIAHDRYVRKSEKSFNSELGVPLTVLGLENAWGSAVGWIVNIIKGALVLVRGNYPEWLVLEVGADRPGDIASIAQWLKPHVVVITSIPDIPVHVEYFESPDRLAKEKRALVEYMRPEGRLIINGDDVHTRRIHEDFRDCALSYGFGGHNDFEAQAEGICYEKKRPVGMLFDAVRSRIYTVPVKLYGALGKPRIYSALAAMAVGEVVGVGMAEAAERLRDWEAPQGRMRLIEGIKGSLIIDDTYNASPSATLSALETLKDIRGFKQKIALLGDMMELGRYSKEAHARVGERAAKSASMLVTVGIRMRAAAEAALDHGLRDEKVRQYEQGESERAGKELETLLDKSTIVLIKGSQSMRMEKAVLEIMAEPLRAEELLVRQDAEWRNR